MVCLCSVVVLNWQDEAATARCVESLRGLNGIDDCEVIVVDNESSDASRRALAGLADVRLLPLERNLGFAGGMNAGITASRGEYVALFNNDLVVDGAWLQEGLRVLQNTNVGIVGGASLDWDGFAKPDRSSKARGITIVDPERGFGVLGAAPPTQREVAGVDGSNLLVRADLMLRLEGFDPGYFAYYEDIDLCARAWALGYASVFNPDMRVWHRRGGSSDRIPRQRAFWAARNHIVTVAKHFPNGTWKRTVARLVVDDISAAVLGHRGGIRTRGVVALDRSQRFGLAQAAWWSATHARYLVARRVATIGLGQHDEGYRDRLQKLAGV